MEDGLKPVVVTTSHRGVFFGYGKAEISPDGIMLLKDAQMCLYWPPGQRGVLGLAKEGPTKGSRIGPVVPALHINNVDAVIEATAEAVKAWRSEPWS